MNDLTEQEILDAAFERVLNHPSFKAHTREKLSSCGNFCEVIRQAPHEHVVQLEQALNVIAMATDDPNEAGGELLLFCAMGAGLKQNSEVEQAQVEFSNIPVTDAEQFSNWVISIPKGKREQAYIAAMDAIIKHSAKRRPDDHAAELTHYQVCIILYYALHPLDELLLFSNYAKENLNTDIHIREQIPGGLWEVFNSRSKAEVNMLLQHWWGDSSSIPNDFFIALELQRQGHIEIHKGKKYLETVVEYLLSSCEPSYGVEAIRLDPFLADELYVGLMQKVPYSWLMTHDIDARAEYLNALFAAGVLKREPVLAALDHGIAKKWEKHFMQEYKTLREKITV